MKCHFCQQEAPEDSSLGTLRYTYYVCEPCNTTYAYHYSGYRGYWIQSSDICVLVRPFHDVKTKITQGNKELVALNYIPDITPSNVQDWVTRLSKLKVFS